MQQRLRTLDLRFFEAKDLEMVDEGISETVESYLERTSGIPWLDKTIVLKVSKRFWLDTYLLVDWVDPVKCVELEAHDAAKIWQHIPFVEPGLMSTPWLGMLDGINLDGFKPLKRSARGSEYEVKAMMLKGANGAKFMRSGTVWGDGYVTPTLGIYDVDVRFDLRLPLAFQIEKAREILENQRQEILSAKVLDEYPSRVDQNGLFQEYLLILDRLEEGGDSKSLVLELDDEVIEKTVRKRKGRKAELAQVKILLNPARPEDGHEKITAGMRTKIVRALKLRNHGFMALAFL